MTNEHTSPTAGRTRLGHVHLKVRDLRRSIEFYTEVLGLEVTETIGGSFAFLTGSDMHHELALQAIGGAALDPPPGAVGMYHVAFEAADREALAGLAERLRSRGVSVHAVDHGISWALYFEDPDGHGVEIYLDRRRHPEGRPVWGGRSRPLGAAEIAPAGAVA